MKYFCRIFCLIIVTVMLCSCQHTDHKKNQITVILDWFVNPDHAPLFVAKQQGYFKAQGLDVKIIAPADPNDGPKLVAAGNADITITYQAGLLQDVDNGLPLMQVGTLFPNTLTALAVLKNGPIKRIEDLKGKTIGSSAANVDQAFIKVMLKHHGVDPKEVKIINVHYNLVQALLTGRVDAISGIMRNFEPIELKLAGHPARLFLPEENGVPNSASEIWVVNRAQAKQAWVDKFLNAIKQGTAYLKAHPEQTFQQFAKQHPELDNPLNHQAWQVTYPLFTDDPFAQYLPAKQSYAQFLLDSGLISKIPPLNSYVLVRKKEK